ncbi:5'-methylthioadenosine/S-adenosylhomocysteine nucleosidase [Agaribacter marinus]|uniref:Phosphorylase n=1 Tax=Agaribacter marinus TaxID=1431249 RepID=A0AA37WHY0_9ALTE|nr:5'-methylthioadenosine/S-adenosylhomocysteine nucleosidase [Agaribacter marinus]GLR70443.1 phosphorylase [Agaribacter marinus]
MKRLLFVLIIFLKGCSAVTPNSSFDEMPEYTALVVAFAPEMDGVMRTIDELPDAKILRKETRKGVTYHFGEYNGEPIVLFATGMSIANAAMTMQMAFDYFPIKQVLYMGIAGAVNPQLHPGDVVVAERWYYHDESVYVNPDPENPGQYIPPNYYAKFLKEQDERRKVDPHTPKYEPFAFIHPDEVVVIKDGLSEPEDHAYFAATPRLLDAARTAINNMPPQAVSDKRNAALYVGGNGVTGSVFMDNREYRKWVRKVFNAEVTEMESAAVGQVAYVNEIDWVIIRAVSDLAGGQEGVNEEDVYDKAASIVGAKVLFATLDELTVK